MKWYKYPIERDVFIEFRALSAEEADRLREPVTTGNPMAEEYIFNLITNKKYDLEELNAGVIPTVVYCSYKLSGFFLKQEGLIDAIDNARKQHEYNIYHSIFYSKIMRIMPGTYKLEELKEKSLNELLELYVLCETIIGSNIHDTAKMREALKEDAPAPGKKGKGKVLNSLTPEILNQLKASLQRDEMDGLPLDKR